MIIRRSMQLLFSKTLLMVGLLILIIIKYLDIPKLPPIEYQPKTEEEIPLEEEFHRTRREEPEAPRQSKKSHVPSSIERPPAPDPYATSDYSTYVLPVAITFICLVPIVLCLCRM